MKIIYKPNKLLLFVLVVQILSGCKIPKNLFFSYKVDSYSTDTTKHLLTSSSLISYGDHLFEFKMRTNIKSVIHGEADSVTSSIDYDTTGVYLLSGKNKLYFEFDTFTIKNKIVKAGKLSEKEFGQKYPASDSVFSATGITSDPADTVINNINCSYVVIVSKNTNAEDSVEVKMILIKNPNLNSLYKIGGAKFADKDYCIVGYDFYSYKNKEGFVQEMADLRPLTKKEQKICESMIIKSKAHIVDTVKPKTP